MDSYEWVSEYRGSFGLIEEHAYSVVNRRRTDVLLGRTGSGWKVAYRSKDHVEKEHYHSDDALPPELTLEEAKAVAIMLWRMQ